MADATDWDDDILSVDEMDDNIIELTDIVDEEQDDATGEEVIELTDIVEDDSHDLDLDIVKEEETGKEDLAMEDEDSFAGGLEIELDDVSNDEPVEPDLETGLPQDFDLSPEMLEAALEKVVEKKFADKIETILFEVMERVIEKEIKEIKDSLQKDLDQIGNA